MGRSDRDPGWRPLFWTVFKSSRNAMAMVDDHRRHIEVNGPYVKLLGFGRRELIGEPMDWFEAEKKRITLREWRARVAKGDHSGEHEMICADGSAVWVEFASHPAQVADRKLVLYVALGSSTGARRGKRTRGKRRQGKELSQREKEIVHLVALGHSGPEIADELHITQNTVRTHMRNAMAKVGARSRAQLVAKSLGGGLLAR
jgi:PAS domain S-box-containing protein